MSLASFCSFASRLARPGQGFTLAGRNSSAFSQLYVRAVSTCSVLSQGRRKFDDIPIPSWANYDGNQKCVDEENNNRLIWEGYKRNFKGGRPPQDINLLVQFICPHSAKILPAKKTGLCRRKQKQLEQAVELARDHGLLPFAVPRKFPEKELRTPPWNRIDVIN